MAQVCEVPDKGTLGRSIRMLRSGLPVIRRRVISFSASDLLYVLIILGLSVIIGVLWLLSIPFHEAPDEAAHFQIVRFILDHGRLPRFDPGELWLIRTPVGVVETYAAFPPLAYMIMAAAAAPLSEGQMWAARAVSVVCYVGTVALTFLAARRAVPGTVGVAAWAAAAVALLPQLVFTAAYVNNDAVGVLLSALLWYLLVVAWYQRPSGWLGLALGATVGALLITKYTFYAVAGVGAASALIAALRLASPERWRSAALVVAGIAATSGWWFWRNWTIYGEVIPGSVIASAKAAAGGNSLFQPAEHGITLLSLSTDTNFWELTLKSFVAGFGFMDLFLPPEHYWLAAGFCVAGLMGLLGLGGSLLARAFRPVGEGLVPSRPVLTRRIRGAGENPSLALLVTALAAISGTLASAMAISAFGEYSPQGRYLFGPLVPVAIGLAAGWVWLSRFWPLRWVPSVAVLSLLGLNLVSLFDYVVPRYYGNAAGFLVQIDQPSAKQDAGSTVEVLGWALTTGGIQWHPFDPSGVSEYRRPVAGVDVYLDGPPGTGRFQGAAEYGFRRPDVRHTYGGPPGIERVGYRLVLARDALSPGAHRVFACPRGAPSNVGCSSRPFEVL